jgi:hypothetical protein
MANMNSYILIGPDGNIVAGQINTEELVDVVGKYLAIK